MRLGGIQWNLSKYDEGRQTNVLNCFAMEFT